MIKKIFQKFITALILFVAFFPNNLKAQIFEGGEEPEKEGVKEIEEALGKTGITETKDVGDLILKYVNFALPYLALACILGVVATVLVKRNNTSNKS